MIFTSTCQNPQVFTEGLTGFSLVPSRPQQHIAASKLCPWSSSSMEKVSTVHSPTMGKAEEPELPSWWPSPAFTLFCCRACRWLGKCCRYQFCCCNYILASRWTYMQSPWMMKGDSMSSLAFVYLHSLNFCLAFRNTSQGRHSHHPWDLLFLPLASSQYDNSISSQIHNFAHANLSFLPSLFSNGFNILLITRAESWL